MRRLSLRKSEWLGNHWPCIEVQPYEHEDFLKVLFHICVEFHVPMPPLIDILDGYAADIKMKDSIIKVHMDNWTFSVATEKIELRDEIFEVLETLEV